MTGAGGGGVTVDDIAGAVRVLCERVDSVSRRVSDLRDEALGPQPPHRRCSACGTVVSSWLRLVDEWGAEHGTFCRSGCDDMITAPRPPAPHR